MHPGLQEKSGNCPGFVNSIRRSLAALILGAGLSTHSHAQEVDAHALLVQMASAIKSLDYQGSFLYQHAGRIDTLRVTHAGGPHQRERLVSLNGPRTEVIRNGTDVTFIQPDGSSVVYPSNSGRGLLPLVPGAAGRRLDENYQLSIAGVDRVAGYATDVIDVQALDSWRYGYRLWLDKDSRLLLRSVVMDSERRILEQFMFVALEIGRLDNETELVPARKELLTTRSEAPDDWVLERNSSWKVASLPPGFKLRSIRKSPRDGEGVEHLVYSDGLANVSIYLEPSLGEALGNATLTERGPLNILTIARNEWRITVVGDVPGATLSVIADSLERIQGSTPEIR